MVITIITHADDSCGSKAFSGVILSVCVSESLQDDSKMNHRQRGSDCTVLTATGSVNG